MVDELGLSGSPLIVYALIYGAGPRGLAMSKREMCWRCGLSRSSLNRALKGLVEAGIVDHAGPTPAGCKLPSLWRVAPETVERHWSRRNKDAAGTTPAGKE